MFCCAGWREISQSMNNPLKQVCIKPHWEAGCCFQPVLARPSFSSLSSSRCLVPMLLCRSFDLFAPLPLIDSNFFVHLPVGLAEMSLDLFCHHLLPVVPSLTENVELKPLWYNPTYFRKQIGGKIRHIQSTITNTINEKNEGKICQPTQKRMNAVNKQCFPQST